jgi:glutamate synthase domain-containing protein 2
VHHFAALLGYGAEAVVPRTALETIAALCLVGRMGGDSPSPEEAQDRFRRAAEEGVLKVMSKMGISTPDAYQAARIFEAVGLAPEVLDLCVAGTPSPLGGLGFLGLGQEALTRHAADYGPRAVLVNPGFVKHRAGGEYHQTNPDVVGALHGALGVGEGLATGFDGYLRFAALVNERPAAEPRDLLEPVPAGPRVPLGEVEPAGRIVKRFSTGAMSLGALSPEAHETLAVALRMIGAKSNTGEGGEDPARYRDERNTLIKQVASPGSGSLRSTARSPTSSRSRWLRAPSPVRAASSPGTR